MLLLLIVCLMKLFEMYSNNYKMTRNKSLHDSLKENQNCVDGSDDKKCDENSKFSINYFYDIDQSCADQLKEFLQMKAGINSSYRGMTDNSTHQPATVKSKLIKTGLLSHQQQAGFQPKPSSLLKQPLSSLNTNHILNTKNNYNNQNNNNYYYEKSSNCCRQPAKLSQQHQQQHLQQRKDVKTDDETLKNDIQIVLNNIHNALINQQKFRQKQQQQYQQDQFYQHQDRFKHLNIFNGGDGGGGSRGSSSPSNSDIAINQRNNNLYLRKMSMSPAECDNTNNNNMLGCSVASDFTHDNSDYQWFIDYGYRDGVQHHSILSSLSASYNGIGELSYYDDLARNIDVNLAEVDIENFRSEDINSLLKIRQNENVPRTLLLKEPTEIDNSICKSEILFSPVKESHISVDSLDMNMMDGYPEDIILTCQANKNNYTIAFEGSCMYSDESYYDFPDNNGRLKQNSINLDNIAHNNINNNFINKKKKANVQGDMTQSDNGFTTWSQLKKSNDHIHIQRCSSGNNNNNTSSNENHTITSNNNNNNNNITTCPHSFIYSARKSSSMPNLKAILQQQQQQHHALNISEVPTTSSQSSYDSDGSKIRTMLQNYAGPIASSESESPAPETSSSNNEKIPAPSFNLVKLFIKQKSSSSDTCMDVSSGCWPSDSTNSSTEHPVGNCSNSSLNRLRKKSMNDSGKFSALSKHEEDAEYQLDSLDAHINNGEKKTNDFNREIFDSPTHRRQYRDCSLNIRNQMKNPLLYNVLNNNNSNSSRSQISDSSRTSENLTQIPTTVPIDMITKSIQTSTALVNTSSESKKLPQSHVKMIPPSFLSQLNKLGDQQQAPVYVIYPNYALPDLEFINHQPINLKKDIIMSPMSYQNYQGQPKMARTLDLKHQKSVPLRKRPQSLDIDRLGMNQYSHVQDWNSLLTLLPRDYKKLLKNVPEVNRIAAMEASISSQKPLFCMSPPIRKNTAGLICDCDALFHNNPHHQNHQTVNSSSSGGSSQPPSSGYRGSSTLLTDSEMEELINGSPDAMKNMFVYQYDNVHDIEHQQQQQKPPVVGKRGILRRTNTTTNTPSRVTASNVNLQKQKRYSMLDQPKSPQQQRNFQVSASEKRKSLQDTNFYHHNDLEDYFNNIGGTKNFANRLPNYMKTRDDQRNDEKDLNQLLTELELNKALSNKLNYGEHDDLEEIEARLKAESILNDTTKLRNEVSKNLTSRKVSFNHPSPTPSPKKHLLAPEYEKKFTTPPNSPQMSQMVDKKQHSPSDKKQRLEKEKQDKIQSNRFKRLQIQWELLSKEQSPVLETKSNVTTPTGLNKCQSKIPRPVSYPNSKQSHDLSNLVGGKNLRSPSKMQAPKKYTTTPTNITSPTSLATPRTPNKQLHTTPKKSLPARPVTRTR